MLLNIIQTVIHNPDFFANITTISYMCGNQPLIKVTNICW